MDGGNSDSRPHPYDAATLHDHGPVFERIAPVKNGIGRHGVSRMGLHLVRVTFCKCGG